MAQGPRILSADRVGGGLLITFDDEKAVFYTASLLHSFSSQAIAMNEQDFDDWHSLPANDVDT
jgi:hypothetical protein